jgi:hypothetical protein
MSSPVLLRHGWTRSWPKLLHVPNRTLSHTAAGAFANTSIKSVLPQLNLVALPRSRLEVTSCRELKHVSCRLYARGFTTSSTLRERIRPDHKQQKESSLKYEDDHDHEEIEDFARSEKAAQAAQVNLSAKLSKEGKTQQSAGFGEVWRLIKIARPEAKVLGVAFVFLLVSSSVSMGVPFSIGKILDVATNAETDKILGLDPGVFYLSLGGILTLGACANYGRIIILRIVGERIVSRLRSQLFRRTFQMEAQFFGELADLHCSNLPLYPFLA